MALALKTVGGVEPVQTLATNTEVVISLNASYPPLVNATLTSVGAGQNLVYDNLGPSLQLKSLGGSSYINVVSNVDGQTINANANLVSLDSLYIVTMNNTGDGIGQVDDGTGQILAIKDLIAGNNISITSGTSGQGNRIVANEPSASTSHVFSATVNTGGATVSDGTEMAWNTITSSTDLTFTTGGTRPVATVSGDYLVYWAVVFTSTWSTGKMGIYVNGAFVPSYSYPASILQRGSGIVHLNVGDYFAIRASATGSATISASAPTSCWLYARRVTNL